MKFVLHRHVILTSLQRGSLHDDLVKRAVTKQHFTEDFALKLFLQVSGCASTTFLILDVYVLILLPDL